MIKIKVSVSSVRTPSFIPWLFNNLGGISPPSTICLSYQKEK
jgi:hypothetical protein